MQLPHPQPGDPKIYMCYGPVEELTGRDWPHIPGDGRITRAHQHIGFQEDYGAMWAFPDIKGTSYQDLEDALTLADWYNAQAHRMSSFLKLSSETPGNPDEMLSLLFDMAKLGETETLMGLSVESDIPEYESEKVAINFDAVPKDPAWMGISHAWQDFRRTEAVVVESKLSPGQPGFVVGMPLQEAAGAFANCQEFPGGLPSQVRDLLKWHQATRVYWLSTS